MPTPSRRSRIAHFKTPFLTSIAGAAMGISCGGRTPAESAGGREDSLVAHAASSDAGAVITTMGSEPGAQDAGASGSGGSGSSDPPGVLPKDDGPLVYEACSGEIPVAGSDCYVEQQACGFSGCRGPTSSTARCVNGQWLIQFSFGLACNPPAVTPICPERTILAGTPCTYEGQECSQESCDGVSERFGTTCSNGIWSLAKQACPQSEADAGIASGNDAGQ